MKKTIEITLNVLFWIIVYYLLIEFFSVENVDVEQMADGTVIRKIIYDPNAILHSGIALAFKIGFYYFNVYLLSKYYQKHSRGGKYLHYLILTALGFILLNIATFVFILDKRLETLIDFFDSVLFLFLQYLIVAILSFAHLVLLRTRKEELLKQQLKKEKSHRRVASPKSSNQSPFFIQCPK